MLYIHIICIHISNIYIYINLLYYYKFIYLLYYYKFIYYYTHMLYIDIICIHTSINIYKIHSEFNFKFFIYKIFFILRSFIYIYINIHIMDISLVSEVWFYKLFLLIYMSCFWNLIIEEKGLSRLNFKTYSSICIEYAFGIIK